MQLGNWISTPQQLEIGLPQGSPLSPVLYHVHTKEQADLNSNDLRRMFTLADGWLTCKTVSDTYTAVQDLQEKVSQWCQETGSEISPSKKQVVDEQTEQQIEYACGCTQLKQERDWGKPPVELKPF